jgi:pilus assembly protein FimV
MSRRVSSSVALVSNTKPLVGALAAALFMCSTSYAASFGHSRIVSALGQPLRIDVPVSQLTPDDLRSLNVVPAPASAWTQAGLIPPVDLASIDLHLADGYTPGSKVIQIRSTEPFDKPVADLLLDVRTASGQQRYQVSLLTHASQDAIRSAGGVSQGSRVGDAAGSPTDQRVLRGMIRVKQGDTMFAIARRHAVRGVTVYQMMMALQRANPRAFIQGNINLVKAGATLAMPDMAGLTAISDKEARRLFAKQAQAFALYRQRLAASTSAVAKEGSASQGVVTPAGQAEPVQSAPAPEDQLRLSRGQASPAASASGTTGTSVAGGGSTGGAAATASAGASNGGAGGSDNADVRADDSVATRKDIDESKERVSQLEQNVKHLNEALQSQGGAATDLIVDGAKGLSQSLADVANAVTSPGDSAKAPEASDAGAGRSGVSSTAGTEAASAAGSTAASDRAAANGSSTPASTMGADGGNGSPASAGPAAGGSAATDVAADGAAANGATANGATANGATPGGSAASGATGSDSAAGGSTASGTPAAGSNASAAGDVPANASTAAPSSADAGKPGAPAASTSASGTSAAGTSAAGTSATGTPAAGAPASAGNVGGDTPANGATASNAAVGSAANGSSGASTSGAADNAASNTTNNAAGSAPGASGTAPATGLASAGQGAGGGTSEGASSGADQTKPSSGADRAGDVAEPISSRAEHTVSWIQEHMLGVITGLLALIVLVIAWLLRRANAGRDDGRDDHTGLITEAMVREKLDQINLDLSQSSADDAPSRRR